jgi:hypothetical protein
MERKLINNYTIEMKICKRRPGVGRVCGGACVGVSVYRVRGYVFPISKRRKKEMKKTKKIRRGVC